MSDEGNIYSAYAPIYCTAASSPLLFLLSILRRR